MYKRPHFKRTTATRVSDTEGETIEDKLKRIKSNKEPITDGAPLIYTERKAGVQAGYDIRTDRMEYAIEASDVLTATHRAKRNSWDNPKVETDDTAGAVDAGGGESEA